MRIFLELRLLVLLVFLSLSWTARAQTLPQSSDAPPEPPIEPQGAILQKGFSAPEPSLESLDVAPLAAAYTAPVVYVCDAVGHLATIDLNAKTVKVIGVMKVKGTTKTVVLTDIGFAPPSKTLYGLSFTQLYKVDPATAVLTKVGTGLGPTGINALTFSKPTTTKPTQAVAASYKSNESGFYSINLTTGKATKTGPNGGFTSAGDFAWSGTHLYFAANGPQASNSRLVNYNYASNPVTYTSHTVNLTYLFGLAVVQPGVLIGFAGTKAYRLTPSTGAASLVFDFTGKGLTRINGAASKSFF